MILLDCLLSSFTPSQFSQVTFWSLALTKSHIISTSNILFLFKLFISN